MLESIPGYWFIPCSPDMMFSTAGARSTMKMHGKMHSTSGKMILILVFDAASSACCFRLVRMSSENLVNAFAIGVPNRSVCVKHVDKRGEFLDLGAVGQVLPGLKSGPARALLAIHLQEFFVDVRVTYGKFVPDAEQRLVQSKTRVHADHHQIQCVRYASANPFLFGSRSSGLTTGRAIR